MSNNSARAALSERKQQGQMVNNEGRDLKTLIEQQKSGITSALTGTALNAERFTRIALTVVRQTPRLLECRSNTVLGALMTSAQLGLEPGTLGEAYLIPYKDVCTFVPGYRGLIKLAWNSGQIRHIDADVVHEEDPFDFEKGTNPFLRHKPVANERHSIQGINHVYAVATMTNGGSTFVVLSVDEVERIRQSYSKGSTKTDNPWQTEWAEMAKKTALRRLAKTIPLSTSVNLALAAEGTVRDSVEESVEDVAGSFIDGEVINEDTDSQGE